MILMLLPILLLSLLLGTLSFLSIVMITIILIIAIMVLSNSHVSSYKLILPATVCIACCLCCYQSLFFKAEVLFLALIIHVFSVNKYLPFTIHSVFVAGYSKLLHYSFLFTSYVLFVVVDCELYLLYSLFVIAFVPCVCVLFIFSGDHALMIICGMFTFIYYS